MVFNNTLLAPLKIMVWGKNGFLQWGVAKDSNGYLASGVMKNPTLPETNSKRPWK